LISDIFTQAASYSPERPDREAERRRETSDVVGENSQEFIYVRYPVSNSSVVEHPIPKQKFLDFEAALQVSGKMNVYDVLSKFRFRRDDRVPLMALLAERGYAIEGQFVFAKSKKAS
jgi:hypothetical protein